METEQSLRVPLPHSRHLQAFFQVWYENQSPAIQATVQGLVASGQLTFVNGGWSMHDEANPTYIDMLGA